jgi:hypothetical protein
MYCLVATAELTALGSTDPIAHELHALGSAISWTFQGRVAFAESVQERTRKFDCKHCHNDTAGTQRRIRSWGRHEPARDRTQKHLVILVGTGLASMTLVWAVESPDLQLEFAMYLKLPDCWELDMMP